MANGGNIRFGVGFDVNTTELNQLKASLQEIQRQASQASGSNKMTKELQESAQAAQKLEKILDGAWNSKLQQFNLNKVNSSIKSTYGSVSKLKMELEKSGAAGATAFNKLGSSLLTTNTQLKQSSKLLDNMAHTMSSTIRWGIASSVMNSFTNSIQKAWSYSKNLDTSLNDIRIVTEATADQMDRFAITANKAAKELGANTLDFTKASLIYYQQGLSDEEVAARAETTVKAANVTGQTGDEVSEQLTAVWNGYKVSAEEAELYVDKLAAVAASTASDLEELSTGMSKVASAASTAGVDIDQLNATLATVVSVTRQAPESVGTAFKTIYARLGDLRVDGVDEFGTTLGEVSGKLQTMGVDILDQQGNMRNMGEVVEEVAGKWATWTDAQKQAAAVAMAGKRQYNNLIALFENWDMYESSLQTSANAAGTLQKQQDIYMESTAAHLKTLQAETQRTYDLMFETDSINGVIDVFDTGLEYLNNFIEGLDGGANALILFGSMFANIFSKQISASILRASNNIKIFANQFKDAKFKQDLLNTGASTIVNQQNAMNGMSVDPKTVGYQAQLAAAKQIEAVTKGLTQEEYQQSLELNKQIGLTAELISQKEQSRMLTKEQIADLRLLGVSQSSSTDKVREKINAEKDNLSTLQAGRAILADLLTDIDRINQKETTRGLILNELNLKEAQFKNTLGLLNMDANEQQLIWKEISTELNKEEIDIQVIKGLLETVSAEESEINSKIAAGNALLNARDPELADDIAQEKERLRLLQQQNTEIAKQGKSSINTQKVVNIGMAAVGAISSMTGAMSVFSDEAATGEQKAHALGSALSGAGMSIGMAFGPVGMIIGGIAGAIGNLIFQTDAVEDAFKSTEEKMEELHQQQQEFISDTQNFRNSKEELESIKEEYEKLSEKAGEYDKTIENLTDEELKRYNELKDVILKYNPDALLAYDAEGNAILKKNETIQETIDLLKEQYELETRDKFLENWEDQKETKKEQRQDASDRVSSAENKIAHYNTEAGKSELQDLSNREIDSGIVNLQKSFLAKELEGASKDQAKEIERLYDEIIEANNEGTLDEELVNNFIESIKTSDIQNSQNLLAAAQQIKDGVNLADTVIQEAQDELVAAQTEKENVDQLDTSAIMNLVKGDSRYSEDWEQLDSLDFEGADNLIQQYIDSLEISEDIPDEEAAAEATREYIKSLYELLSNMTDPNAFINEVQSFDKSQFTSIEGYNQAVIAQMQSLIDSNSGIFEGMAAEEKTNLLKALYGVSDVTLDGEGNINQIANDYKTTLQDKFSEIFSESAGIEGALLSDSSALDFTNVASNFLGPEEIENFDTIWELTDKSAKSAGELMQNLEKAAQTWREQQEELNFNESVAANGALYAEEYDIDEEQYKNLSKIIKDTADELEDLSDDLLDNGDAVQEVAKDILRYDKAVESVKENSEDWMKILKSDNLQDQADIVDDLADAYGNMFDIDGSELSSDFLTSVDNLELLKQAANGSEEAYNQLRAEMGKEILAQVGIDQSQYEQDLAAINALAATNENLGLADVQAGASLDNTAFLDALSDMVTKAGMTADQATDYLSSMGIDAEVTTADKWQEEIIGFNTTPKITPIPFKANLPMGDGPSDYSVPMVTYNATPLRRMKKVSGAGLKVTSANKSAGGGVKFAHSSHGGGASGGSGGSGGGGGGGGSSQPKVEKKVESKFDRYHDVNQQLEDVANELEEIEEEQERLFGKDLIDSLTRQTELLQRQRELQEEKLSIAREEQKELQNTLSTQGVRFDEEGFISNYEAIIKQKEAEYNTLIDQYNAMSAEEQETFKENVLDPAKETLDKFYEDIEAYDEMLTGTIPEIEREIREAMNQEIEANVDKFNLSVELRLEVADLQEQWSDFKKDFSLDEDDIFGNALEDFNLYSQLTSGESIQDLTDHINRTMESIQNINNGEWDPIFGDNKQLALEELEGYMDSLMDSMLDVKELQEAINESYLESIDAIGEAVDKQAEKFEQVNDLLEHNMNIVKLLNGEDAYKEMTVYYEKMKENNLQMLANSKQAENYYREELEKARKAGDEDAAERWTELWEAEVANGKELLESSIETLIDSYTNSINVIFDELNDKLTDGKGLNYVNLEWELNNENQDAYLDSINAEYEMQQLERKYRDSIDSADGIKTQRELNKLMDEELSKLREKDKLTQYDIDRANAKYELKLKEIALEEAQQNKSQMRLRRDSSGGYSYQFVADQDGISQAQQELDEARNSLYNMDKDQYRENQQEILDVWNEFQEKMRDSANMSAEEKELIEQTYMERIKGLINENNVIRVNLTESATDEMSTLFDEMAMNEDDILINEVVPNWDSSVQKMIEKLTGESEDSLAPAVQEAFSQMTLLTQDFDAELAQIEETAGISFAALEEGYDTNIELASKLAEEQQKNIDKTIEQKEATQDLRDEVNSLAESYKAVFEQATNALDAAIKLDNYEKEKAAAEAARLAAEQAAANGGGDGSGGDGSGGGSGSGSGGNSGGSAGTLTAEVIDGVAGALYYWTPAGWGNGAERKNKMEAKFGAGAYSQIQSYINQHVSYSGALKTPFNYGFGDRDKYKQYFYDKFDTGGYTGDWNGDEGRTALLHKKELVLNKTDTENILSAVGIVRDMEAMLNSLTNSMTSRINGLTNSLMSDFSFTRDTGELQQNVQIEANFPNVSDRAEIEEAFENLVNMASQHAYNTQR